LPLKTIVIGPTLLYGAGAAPALLIYLKKKEKHKRNLTWPTKLAWPC